MYTRSLWQLRPDALVKFPYTSNEIRILRSQSYLSAAVSMDSLVCIEKEIGKEDATDEKDVAGRSNIQQQKIYVQT